MKLGFIGCGNMARAILGGVLESGLCAPGDVRVADASAQAVENFTRDFGVGAAGGNRDLAGWAQVLVLAIKPQVYETVIADIRESCPPGQLVISIAPGKTLQWLGQQFLGGVHLVRAMPNTPALVGAGITALCAAPDVPPEQKALALSLLQSFGMAQEVPEHLMDAVVSVSGSSPAYVFMMIEAMADAAVAQGMPRQQAYTFAAQAVLGSAKMVLETGLHPGALKDMVCSPGGTTIEAVQVLERTGFRASLMEAMRACGEKSRGM